jgi:hypothetical protein
MISKQRKHIMDSYKFLTSIGKHIEIFKYSLLSSRNELTMPLSKGLQNWLMYHYSLCIFGRIDDFDISVCESVMRPPPEMFKKPLLNKYVSVSHKLNLFYSSFFECFVFFELSSK